MNKKSKMKYLKRNSNNKVSLAFLVLIFLMLTAAVVFLVCIFVVHDEDKSLSITAVPSTNNNVSVTNNVSKLAETTEVPETVTTAFLSDETNSEDFVNSEPPEEFSKLIAENGYGVSDFDFEQLIVVNSYGTSAEISFFEKTGGVWDYASELYQTSGYVGSQGTSEYASEYASYTPIGLFSIGTGFGICQNPGTGLDYFEITEDSYWVDDANSVYYNQHVEGTENQDWQSAEHLIDYQGSYNYCAFIEYNTNPIVAGKGSAIFLHVGNAPTAGCVAISEECMIATLRWLDKNKYPHILIL